jgi:hypothetical protein
VWSGAGWILATNLWFGFGVGSENTWWAGAGSVRLLPRSQTDAYIWASVLNKAHSHARQRYMAIS